MSYELSVVEVSRVRVGMQGRCWRVEETRRLIIRGYKKTIGIKRSIGCIRMDGRHRVGEGIVTKRGICIWDDLRRLHGTVERKGIVNSS